MSITVSDEVYLEWTTSLHMCVYQAVKDFKQLVSQITGTIVVLDGVWFRVILQKADVTISDGYQIQALVTVANKTKAFRILT